MKTNKPMQNKGKGAKRQGWEATPDAQRAKRKVKQNNMPSAMVDIHQQICRSQVAIDSATRVKCVGWRNSEHLTAIMLVCKSGLRDRL
jgi:hypothetical protein